VTGDPPVSQLAEHSGRQPEAANYKLQTISALDKFTGMFKTFWLNKRS